MNDLILSHSHYHPWLLMSPCHLGVQIAGTGGDEQCIGDGAKHGLFCITMCCFFAVELMY